MKFTITVLAAAATLAATVASCGFSFNAPVILSIWVAAGIAGIFAADYSRPAACNLDPVKAPARPSRARRPVETSPVFASLIVFNTTVA